MLCDEENFLDSQSPAVMLRGTNSNCIVLCGVLCWRASEINIYYYRFKELYGNGILFQDGSERDRSRSMLRTSLNRKSLPHYLPRMRTIVSAHIQQWISSSSNQESHPLYQLIKRCSTDVVLNCFLGLNVLFLYLYLYLLLIIIIIIIIIYYY